MKIRNGFVSNSSSSSFVLGKSEITEEQWKDLIIKIKKFNDNSWEGGETYLYVGKKYLFGKLDYADADNLYGILNGLNIPKDSYEDMC